MCLQTNYGRRILVHANINSLNSRPRLTTPASNNNEVPTMKRSLNAYIVVIQFFYLCSGGLLESSKSYQNLHNNKRDEFQIEQLSIISRLLQ